MQYPDMYAQQHNAGGYGMASEMQAYIQTQGMQAPGASNAPGSSSIAGGSRLQVGNVNLVRNSSRHKPLLWTQLSGCELWMCLVHV